MKFCLVFFALIISVVSLPRFNEELNQSWSLFKNVFNKNYSSNDEELKRRQIWEDNVEIIRKHNLEYDLGLHSFTLGINPFADLTNEEFVKQRNGFRMNLHKNSSRTFVPLENFVLPDSVDWRTKGYVTPVKDQGQCGSCWSFSTTGSLEGQHFNKTGQLVSLSEQNLVDCTINFGCHGGVMEIAFEYIKSNGGIDTEQSYPYQAERHECRFDPKNVGATDTGFVQIKTGNENDLQAAIATVGPISVAIDAAKSSFQLYKSGVYDEPHCSTIYLDHAVLAVGYGTLDSKPYYLVKNSWGTNWGQQGYIMMSRNQHNQCGIATLPSYPLV